MNKGSEAPEFKKGFSTNFCCKKLLKRLQSHASETRAPAGLPSPGAIARSPKKAPQLWNEVTFSDFFWNECLLVTWHEKSDQVACLK